ncbi:MAG: hypothetical protein ACLQVW_13810, partial [Limisphaerales bacterium]
DLTSAEQPAATQTRLENTSAKAVAEAPSASVKPPPLAQLKSRYKEEIDWACDLDSAMTRAQAIAQIKERLGIDLRWPTTYARFLQWCHQQRRQSGLAARLGEFRQFEAQCDLPASLAAIEAAAAALFLEQSVLQQDAALFLSLLRLRLRERTLALQEKKLALEQDRLHREAAAQAVRAPPPAEPPREPAPIASSPFKHAKPPQKTQCPCAEPKRKNTTLRRKTQFPSPLFRRKKPGRPRLGSIRPASNMRPVVTR